MFHKSIAKWKFIEYMILYRDRVFLVLPIGSANIHRSFDGTRVVNYSQWKTKEAFEHMLQDSVAQKHTNEALSVSNAEPHLYQVVSVYNR
jgi:hypothetical protein